MCSPMSRYVSAAAQVCRLSSQRHHLCLCCLASINSLMDALHVRLSLSLYPSLSPPFGQAVEFLMLVIVSPPSLLAAGVAVLLSRPD